MSVRIRVSEHEGEAVAFDGQFLSIVLPKAFAPGQPLTIAFVDAEAPLRIEGRSLGSKRLPEGRFEIRLRLVSPRREHQAILSSLRR
jgi:hypothetical protein